MEGEVETIQDFDADAQLRVALRPGIALQDVRPQVVSDGRRTPYLDAHQSRRITSFLWGGSKNEGLPPSSTVPQ